MKNVEIDSKEFIKSKVTWIVIIWLIIIFSPWFFDFDTKNLIWKIFMVITSITMLYFLFFSRNPRQ